MAMPFAWIAALRFLREGRMQTVLIIAGVALGVAVIVFMSALLTALQGNIIRRSLSSQPHIAVLPPEEASRPQRGDAPGVLIAPVRQARAQRLRSVDQWQKVRDRLLAMPEVTALSPVAAGPAFATRGDADKSVSLIGIDPEQYPRIIPITDHVVAGQYRLTSADVMIGTELARDLGIGVGDKVRFATAVGRSDTLNVSAIFDLGNKGANQRNVYVALRTAQSLHDLPGGVSSMELTVRDVFQAEVVARRIAAETGLEVDSWIQTNSQLFTALTAQTFSNTVIRVFVAISAAFGIASVLVVSVVQRSREIGILRAIGTSRRQVMDIFLIQGALVGLAGSLAGSALGGFFLALWRVAARNPDGTPLFDIVVDPWLFLWAAALATATGLLAAMMPARRAARLDPVVAIRG